MGVSLCCSTQASHCGGFSCCRAQALGTRASVVVARGFSSCSPRALERRLTNWGARAYLLRSMWDLHGPRLKPVSPALAGGFLTPAPPGKSLFFFLKEGFYLVSRESQQRKLRGSCKLCHLGCKMPDELHLVLETAPVFTVVTLFIFWFSNSLR